MWETLLWPSVKVRKRKKRRLCFGFCSQIYAWMDQVFIFKSESSSDMGREIQTGWRDTIIQVHTWFKWPNRPSGSVVLNSCQHMAQRCFFQTHFWGCSSLKEGEQGNSMSAEATPSTSPGFRVTRLEQRCDPKQMEATLKQA